MPILDGMLILAGIVLAEDMSIGLLIRRGSIEISYQQVVSQLQASNIY